MIKLLEDLLQIIDMQQVLLRKTLSLLAMYLSSEDLVELQNGLNEIDDMAGRLNDIN
jgi:hypothetical protein